jgi:hypothetical protein
MGGGSPSPSLARLKISCTTAAGRQHPWRASAFRAKGFRGRPRRRPVPSAPRRVVARRSLSASRRQLPGAMSLTLPADLHRLERFAAARALPPRGCWRRCYAKGYSGSLRSLLARPGRPSRTAIGILAGGATCRLLLHPGVARRRCGSWWCLHTIRGLIARPRAVRKQRGLVSRAERPIASDRGLDLGQRLELQIYPRDRRSSSSARSAPIQLNAAWWCSAPSDIGGLPRASG